MNKKIRQGLPIYSPMYRGSIEWLVTNSQTGRDEKAIFSRSASSEEEKEEETEEEEQKLEEISQWTAWALDRSHVRTAA